MLEEREITWQQLPVMSSQLPRTSSLAGWRESDQVTEAAEGLSQRPGCAGSVREDPPAGRQGPLQRRRDGTPPGRHRDATGDATGTPPALCAGAVIDIYLWDFSIFMI